MTDPSDPIALTAHLALVSSISFGGFPTVLPDVRNFVVSTHGWMTNQEFANLFAMAQSIPGPNMILMMSLVGWKVWGFPGAVASAFATFGTKVWVPNVVQLLLGITLTCLCFHIARSIMKPAAAAFAAALFLVLDFGRWLDATHHWFSLLAVLAATAVMLRGSTAPRVLICGALLGLASFFTQTRGVVAALGFAGFLVWEGIQQRAAGRRHAAGSGSGVNADEIGARDHLDIIGAAPAHPAVGDADDGKALTLRLFDRMAGGMKDREHADIVAGVELGRKPGFRARCSSCGAAV